MESLKRVERQVRDAWRFKGTKPTAKLSAVPTLVLTNEANLTTAAFETLQENIQAVVLDSCQSEAWDDVLYELANF